jgi:transposase
MCVSKEDLGLAQKNDRLRRVVRILKEEWDILKSHPVLCGSKAMRFGFIEEHID